MNATLWSYSPGKDVTHPKHEFSAFYSFVEATSGKMMSLPGQFWTLVET